MTNQTNIDREAWLTRAGEHLLRELIMPNANDGHTYPAPPVRFSVGHPKGVRGGRGTPIACCYAREASADGTNEIFVTPTIDCPQQTLASLVHELIHALLNNAGGHRGEFRRIAVACGLTGPMPATVPGAELDAYLKDTAELLGPYPHARIDEQRSGRRKQPTRMVKLTCDACSWLCRTTQKHLATLADGPGTCPACGKGKLTGAE